MAIFHVVLGDKAVVLDSFLCKKVNGVGLLKKCISDVFFIPENLTDATDEEIQGWATKLNTRPKKCLNWKTPYEIFYKTVLHLI
jgi:hypothetical protein|nr:hypothetical protein [Aerococcus sp. 1KP-2016]